MALEWTQYRASRSLFARMLKADRIARLCSRMTMPMRGGWLAARACNRQQRICDAVIHASAKITIRFLRYAMNFLLTEILAAYLQPQGLSQSMHEPQPPVMNIHEIPHNERRFPPGSRISCVVNKETMLGNISPVHTDSGSQWPHQHHRTSYRAVARVFANPSLSLIHI